jgi:hypothetical protein
MKKIIFPIAILGFSLTLFSFSTNNEKKADYNELKKADFVEKLNAGSFTKYEANHYTGDQGSWSRRVSVWSLTDGDTSLDNVEKALNN